jgi:hypothetical protein
VDTGVKERTAYRSGAGPGPATNWSRIVVTGLLLVIVIVGVRAGFALTWQSGWQGPWHDKYAGIAMAVALELLCVVLLGALAARKLRSPHSGNPARTLRIAMTRLIAGVMVALGAALLTLLHIHFARRRWPSSPFRAQGRPRRRPSIPASHGSGAINLDIVRDVAVAIIVLALAALLVILLRRRAHRDRGFEVIPVDDGTALREAVEAGRIALGELSEPRMAIISCYLAMERSLAEAGTARSAAETPDELLTRSAAAGLLHGDAPVELTALFYEARFSTHPVPESARDRALRAIDAILADLDKDHADTGPAPAGSVSAP